MAVLSHNASLPAKISKKTPEMLGILMLFGGGAVFFFCAISILSHLATSTPIHYMWWAVTAIGGVLSAWEWWSSGQRIKYTINRNDKADVYKVTEAYWSLNKGHRQMAKPLMDRLVQEYPYSNAFQERADRIYALQAREEAMRPVHRQDDSDLCEIDAYLEINEIVDKTKSVR